MDRNPHQRIPGNLLAGREQDPFREMLHVAIPHRSDYLNAYVNDPGMMPDCLLCKQRSSMRAEAAAKSAVKQTRGSGEPRVIGLRRPHCAGRRPESLTESGWFAGCPSGTKVVYKVYAKSCRGQDSLRRILAQAKPSLMRRSRRERQRNKFKGSL